MKCIFLGFLLFATASASYGGGGGGYTGGYDDEYQLNGFTNGKGAVVNVLLCAKYWDTRYKYQSTAVKMTNAVDAAPLQTVENTETGTLETTSGISSATELAGLVLDLDKDDSKARRNSSMEYERRSNKCGYCKQIKKRCYNVVRQMKATCDEFRQYKVNRFVFENPYTVKLAGGRRIWKKDYGGKSGGYGGQWRKRSGYGNYAGYVIPRNKNGILLATYTVYSCKRIPSNYGSGYGSGGSGYKGKRGNYYGPRCPPGHYMDYETTTIAVDTYIHRNKLLYGTLYLRTPVCAEDAYAGAALSPGMRYALVPTGPDYESKSNYGGGYGGGSGSGGSWRRSVY